MSKSLPPLPSNSHSTPDAPHRSIFSILEAHASRQSSVHAIMSEDLTLTYAELFERVSACARLLMQQGLVPGRMTAVSLSQEIDHLLCATALMCLGTPQINLASHETEVNKEALASKLGVTQVIARQSKPWMAEARVFSPPPAGEAASSSGAAPDAVLNDIPLDAILLYCSTSGSTNVPKTFGLSFERLLLVAKRQTENLSERRVLRTSSIEFDSSRLHRMCALLAGNTCVFSSYIDLKTLGELCARAEVSELHIGTYKLASLLRAGSQNGQKLPSFTRVLTGGSRVPGMLRRTVRERLTKNLWVSYATSEVGPISLAPPEQHEDFPEGVGLPLPGVTVTIVDANENLLPDGEVGQARIRKAAMPRGYRNDAAASSAFRNSWFYPRDLLSRTENGPLVFHGRVDDMMILNGINIFPEAIEDTLESHPDVREAVAYARKSRLHGDIPVAAVVLKEGGQQRNAPHLIDYCRRILGIRAPREVLVVEQIPRTSAGKPLRRDLAES